MRPDEDVRHVSWPGPAERDCVRSVALGGEAFDSTHDARTMASLVCSKMKL